MKKLFISLAIAAKALTLAAGVMLYAGSADTANAEDCNPCMRDDDRLDAAIAEIEKRHPEG